jgi:antitoxin component YwqK of YwqJK toxin-antitoxin module
MRLILVIFGLWMAKAGALECQSPALLKQADGQGDTLHSWCEVEGVREGIYEVVSLRNGLELRATYKKNKLDGPFKRFSNNTVVVDGNYSAGHMSGEWIRHWSSGEVRDRGTWKDDRPTGKWQTFTDKGTLENEVTYDAEGKVVSEEIPKPKKKLTSADHWRLRLGFAHTKRDSIGDTQGVAVGADYRLFGFGRWFRTDIGLRIVPDYRSDNNFNTGNCNNNCSYNNGSKVYSGQFALSFDFFPNLTDPIVFYGRFGVHDIAFNKPRVMAGIGLRYHFTNQRENWVPNGIFAEFSASDGENNGNNNNNNNQGPGPGPGPNNNSNNGSGAETFFVGALWAFY